MTHFHFEDTDERELHTNVSNTSFNRELTTNLQQFAARDPQWYPNKDDLTDWQR